MERPTRSVLALLALVVAAAVAAPAARAGAGGDPPTPARTWTIEDVRLGADEHLSVGFHPDVARAEVRASGGRFEVCPAVMDGTAGGGPGQSWPSSTGFDHCLASDARGRVLLPGIVVPTFHVAFLVRGIDGAAVRLSTLRVRYAPADGFFAFSVPAATTSFSVVPRDERSVSVDPVPRNGSTIPPALVVRATQQGRRVGREPPTEVDEPHTRRFGPVSPDRPVVVRITRAGDADLAFLVGWA